MKPRKSPPAGSAALQSGLVIASHGRHCVVETADGQRVICHPRGKKSQAVAGDRVLWQASQDEGCIERIEPRRNLLYRQDEMRTKSFAANTLPPSKTDPSAGTSLQTRQRQRAGHGSAA